MQALSLLIKPASGMCNLRCTYCFYHDLQRYGAGTFGIMEAVTARRLIDLSFAACDGTISFCFQGGEPTCAGLDFFRDFSAYASECNEGRCRLEYSIQTNGTLLDKEWVVYLANGHYLTGLSLDGPSEFHNRFRTDARGKGSHSKALQAWRLLNQTRVPTNILAVVTNESARHPAQLYQYFKKLGAKYLQFIPCLDPLGKPCGEEPHSLSPKRYGQFLCGLFDLWYTDFQHGEYISIRLFDDWIHNLAGLPSSSCASQGRCGETLVIEADGSAYPCDFYVTAEQRLGSIWDHTLEELLKRAKPFREQGQVIPDGCRNCPFLQACRGGCKRNRVVVNDIFERDYHCLAYRQFFEYAWSILQALAKGEADCWARFPH